MPFGNGCELGTVVPASVLTLKECNSAVQGKTHIHTQIPKQSGEGGKPNCIFSEQENIYYTARPTCPQSNQHSEFSLAAYSNINLIQTGCINMVIRKTLTNS